MDNHDPTRSAALAWALGGPAAAGASLGLGTSLSTSLSLALAFPAILTGAAILTTPALYVGSAFAGVAPASAQVLGAVARALRDAGLVLLGMAPALLFLTGTAPGVAVAHALAHGALLLATLVALRVLYRRLFAADADGAIALYVVWCAVTLGIGGHLLHLTLSAS